MPLTSFRPELLAPAGNLAKLRVALRYGANAVYLGGPTLSLRSGTGGFDRDAVAHGVELAHAAGVQVYYCLNAFPLETDLTAVRETLVMLDALPPGQRVDGVIIADPGVFALARKFLPNTPVHVSTQANTGNSAAVAFWQELGATRVNLARELTLRDLRQIRRAVPDMELELFVHGAMCLALSGRCSLSAHLNARSANKGSCTQPCRFNYRPHAQAMVLEEQLRPGDILWEVLEGEDFTAFFSPRDVCLVKYLPWLCRNRINALKIEGRMRSAAYVALACDVYRTALDDFGRGCFQPSQYLHELGMALHRPMDSGFFLPGAPAATAKRWDCLGTKTMVGHLQRQEVPGQWLTQVLDRWNAGEPVEVVLPGLRRPVLRPGEYGLENERGDSLELAHPGQRVMLRCDHPECYEDIFIRQTQSVATGRNRGTTR
ncbi:peptidase U32 family protein [Desulfonatronum thioautotrophicum]|uniref:peptidase U32 family protein n=1 Tax=Desulfonatronum thioautotrophicum TaxID=617001 RepID=UPI0005EAE7B1|nr:peptidase U32 family protein [Desulfonatronum thioautotrophicum]